MASSSPTMAVDRVHQGINEDKDQARRYHWHSESLASFVEAPPSAIDGPVQGQIVNLTDKRAAPSRDAQLELLADFGPDSIVREYMAMTTEPAAQGMLPHLVMPAHHDVRSSDVFTRRLHGTLAAAAERGPVDFPELLLTPGVGARTVQSLAMVAEVVHGAPYRFADPGRFSRWRTAAIATLPRPHQGLRRDDSRAEFGRAKGQTRTRRRNADAEAARRSGATTGAHRQRADIRGLRR
jgi:hypothetical protein